MQRAVELLERAHAGCHPHAAFELSKALTAKISLRGEHPVRFFWWGVVVEPRHA